METGKPETIDEYNAGFPPEKRALLEKIRTTIRDAAPDAKGPRRLQAFLTNIASEEVLAFDLAAAELAGRIQGELERVGQPIGRADPMIAAAALQNGLELVSGNTHSQRIQQIGYPLVLINWRI